MNELSKAYNPKSVEDKMYQLWEQSGKFNPDNLDVAKDAENYCIPLPPPNATGMLHIGHAMYTIEDIMIRHARMQGKRTLWLPGTDHAAIAVNAIIERQLRDEGLTREKIDREEFLKRVWAFIETSQGRIKEQLQKMGFSLDWSREAFTMDAERSKVVQEVFKRMYEDGLIYRGIRVINWDPVAQSTISDDEVEHKEQEATLYTFRYAKDFPIAISSTRPETKVGDTAVAVHPTDKRYQKYIGESFTVDFAGAVLHLRIVADENIDPKFGTGALGVTPAHSLVDAEIARKNNLPFVAVIGEDGKMTLEAGSLVSGMPIHDARSKVLAWLQKNQLLEKEETITQNLSVSERTGAAVEPLPKEQWFINVSKPFGFRQSPRKPIAGLKDGQQVTLKELMRHVVENGQIQFVPERFVKIYFQWIDNLRDWNISRQIWFGHQVPVWYNGKEIHVGEKPEELGWTQDPDTLDTWFSSGTWTFSTLGWSKETEDLRRYHPATILETGYDIIFFWVARMILMTTYTVGEVPFKTVYLHGLVRDKHGAKMSKSKGNGIDPLEMIDKYGTDALRLALVTGTTPGNDTRLYEEKIEGYRNFVNKFWNIARYILSTVENPRYVKKIHPKQFTSPIDWWIDDHLNHTIGWVDALIKSHFYGLAIEKLYYFTWTDLADQYLEFSKVEKGKDEILTYILSTLIRLWHPYAPFITEHLYQMLEGHGETLMTEEWPTHRVGYSDDNAIECVDKMQKIITAIRNMRAELHIPYSRELLISGDLGLAKDMQKIIESMGKVKMVDKVKGKTLPLQKGCEMQLEGVVDFKQEREKTEKELKSAESYVRAMEKKLANKKFTANAPESIVSQERAKLKDAKDRTKSLEAKLKQLKS